MQLKRFCLLAVAALSFGVGILGMLLPLLPSFPFFLLSAVCLAHSSPRWHRRFVNSRIYRIHLQDFAEGRGMPLGSKLRAMLLLSVLLGFGAWMLRERPMLLPVLALVWLFHLILFCFFIKTKR